MLLWKSPSSCFPSLLCSDIYLTKSETGRKFLLDTGGQMGWYCCLLRPQPFICGPGSEITLSFVPFLDSTLFQTDAVRFNAVNSSFLHPYPIKKTLLKENGFTIQVLLDSWEPDKQHLKCAQMTSHQRLLMHHHTMLTNLMQFKQGYLQNFTTLIENMTQVSYKMCKNWTKCLNRKGTCSQEV